MIEQAQNEEEYHKLDEEYYSTKWANGLLKISNYGCGISLNLVVNGKEYGNIWFDDRCNGICLKIQVNLTL